jgi:hypothetical protein
MSSAGRVLDIPLQVLNLVKATGAESRLVIRLGRNLLNRAVSLFTEARSFDPFNISVSTSLTTGIERDSGVD